MKKTALVLLTENFEEIEAVTPIDILRRAGIETVTASITGYLSVKGRSGISMRADVLLEELPLKLWDVVVLPGGPGTSAMREDRRVLDLISEQVEGGRFVAAICAAPTVLKDAGVLKGKKLTAHQSVVEEFTAVVEKEAVVVDGNVITSRGAGTSVQFALAIVERLCGYNMALQIAHAICTEI